MSLMCEVCKCTITLDNESCGNNCACCNKPMSKRALAALEKSEAIEAILKLIAGDNKPVIYTVARRVRDGANGTSVELSLFYIKGSELYNLTYYTGKVLGRKIKNTGGYNTINNTGGGMDLGFDIVYGLSSYLFAGAGNKLSHRWL